METCEANQLRPVRGDTSTTATENTESLTGNASVGVAGLVWGSFKSSLFENRLLNRSFNYVIAADCFYDSKDFDDVLATVRYYFDISSGSLGTPSSSSSSASTSTSALASPTSGARPTVFLTTYQERSVNRSLLSLLLKWKMRASEIPIHGFYPMSKMNLLDSSNVRFFVIYDQGTSPSDVDLLSLYQLTSQHQ